MSWRVWVSAMTEAEDIQKIVRALKMVPETKLLIIELARKAVNEDGELDMDKLTEMQREVNLAVAQANAYANGTKRAVQALQTVKARQGEW